MDELKAMVELIKKKELAPTALSFKQCAGLVSHLLDQLEDLHQDRLSGGSPME